MVWVPLVPLKTGSKLGISPLMLAAMDGHTQAAKLLLDHGADINAQVGGAGWEGRGEKGWHTVWTACGCCSILCLIL